MGTLPFLSEIEALGQGMSFLLQVVKIVLRACKLINQNPLQGQLLAGRQLGQQLLNGEVMEANLNGIGIARLVGLIILGWRANGQLMGQNLT